ncbi:MAG TPA: alpha/beta hydrolase [Candidatus Nanoarchaeia archaeon]|nr:alpha/beta hydrolase [Candidatus Nanoarchaeia archaeon]
MKRAIIVHGWDGVPNDSWKPWLKKELERSGFQILAPQMPGGLHPKLNEWIKTISQTVGVPDKDTYFIGHSLGCISIVRYLTTLPKNNVVGGCVLIAGFSGNIRIPEISEFYSQTADVEKARDHCNNFVIIHSDNDEDVPMKKAIEFKDQLKAKFILEHNKGHLSESDNVKELPSALNAIKEMSV